jgi:hypothetical protein
MSWAPGADRRSGGPITRRTIPPLAVRGALMEIVRLDGMRDGLSDADFEKFIESFPIETR